MHLLGNIQDTAIKRIRELVKVRKNERTFDQIADAADIHVRTLHRYLEEKGPSFDMKLSTLEGFAEVLGVAPEYLISENAPAPVIIEPTPQQALDILAKALTERRETPTPAPKVVEATTKDDLPEVPGVSRESLIRWLSNSKNAEDLATDILSKEYAKKKRSKDTDAKSD